MAVNETNSNRKWHVNKPYEANGPLRCCSEKANNFSMSSTWHVVRHLEKATNLSCLAKNQDLRDPIEFDRVS